MQVVLPDPFGPTSPSTSPGARWKLTPSSARKPPKRFTRSYAQQRGLRGHGCLGAVSSDTSPLGRNSTSATISAP